MYPLSVYLEKIYARFWELFGGLKNKKTISIAEPGRSSVLIIIPHDKSWWAINVVQHFVSTLRDHMGYSASPEIDIVSVSSSSEVLSSLLLTINNGTHCDLVVTIGSWVTQEVRNYFDTLPQAPAQIFCGVIDPVGIGIVDSLERPGREVSGVATLQFDFALQIDMLKSLCPDLHAIAIVCGAASGNNSISGLVHHQLNRFRAVCRERGIEVALIQLATVQEIEPALSRARDMHGIGMVCVLNDLFVSAQMEALVAGCKAVRVPLCANELSSVYHGAAIGFGEHGGVYGMYAASLAYEFLVNHHSLAVTPVIMPPVQPAMRYNYDAMVAQGMVLSASSRHLLNMVSVFFQSKQ